MLIQKWKMRKGYLMTSGEIYNQNKQYYDKLAKEYIKKNLVNIDDVCYVPFAMKTYYTRAMIKKINNDEYICFDGYVKDIEADELYSFKYVGDTNNKCNRYTEKEIIILCAFEFSINNYYRELLEKNKQCN